MLIPQDMLWYRSNPLAERWILQNQLIMKDEKVIWGFIIHRQAKTLAKLNLHS